MSLTDKKIERCEASNLRPAYDNHVCFGFNVAAKLDFEAINFIWLGQGAVLTEPIIFDMGHQPAWARSSFAE